MSYAWFLYTNEVVSGPFTTDEVKTKLAAEGNLTTQFIWWKGQREWIPAQAWQEQLQHILANSAGKQKAVWYIDLGTSPVGPLTQSELIENLKSVADLGRVRLWSVGMPNWKSLYELHDVMELLGISRREYDRAPLMGSVAVTRSNEDPRGIMTKAASIGVGGIGVSGAHDLRRGDEVAVLIKSRDIPDSLHLRGEVVYVTESGHAGIRFSKVHPETHTLIHDYVKRFTEADRSSRSAA